MRRSLKPILIAVIVIAFVGGALYLWSQKTPQMATTQSDPDSSRWTGFDAFKKKINDALVFPSDTILVATTRIDTVKFAGVSGFDGGNLKFYFGDSTYHVKPPKREVTDWFYTLVHEGKDVYFAVESKPGQAFKYLRFIKAEVPKIAQNVILPKKTTPIKSGPVSKTPPVAQQNRHVVFDASVDTVEIVTTATQSNGQVIGQMKMGVTSQKKMGAVDTTGVSVSNRPGSLKTLADTTKYVAPPPK